MHRVGRGITMPSEVEVVAAGRGSVSVLLHLWAKFRNQTRSIVADKGLGNWDDERVCHVKFRWSRTSGTRSIHGISSVSSATRFFRPTVAFGSGSRTAHTSGVKFRVAEKNAVKTADSRSTTNVNATIDISLCST